jgi:hypothetical protein
MRLRTPGAASLLPALWLAAATPVEAADMTGAWATDVAACDKMFARNGSSIRFRSGAHRYGNGFILENDRIRGRIATCKIKWRDGQATELTATCSGSVIDTAQFTLKVIDNQQLGRVISGRPEPEIFRRCWP